MQISGPCLVFIQQGMSSIVQSKRYSMPAALRMSGVSNVSANPGPIQPRGFLFTNSWTLLMQAWIVAASSLVRDIRYPFDTVRRAENLARHRLIKRPIFDVDDDVHNDRL